MSSVTDDLNNNVMSFLRTTASNYELSIDSVNDDTKSIFEYYDLNHDKVLQRGELEKLKNDLQNVNTDNYNCDFSNNEQKNFIKNFLSNSKMSIINLNNLLKNILDNYKTCIQTEANGEIESFEQGKAGDCWMLSQLKSLSQTTWGKEAIKNSIIKNNDTNSYTIKFAGVNFETTITPEDIQEAKGSNKYAKGDLDVLLFEIATERYMEQEVAKGNIVRGENVLDGNLSCGNLSMQYLLTGKTGHSFYMQNMSEDEHKAYLKNVCSSKAVLKNSIIQNQDYISNAYNRETMAELLNKLSKYSDCAILCSFSDAKDWFNSQSYSDNIKNDEFSNSASHEYMIKNIKKDANGNIIDIEISNPWNSDVPIHKTLDEFIDQMSCITITTEEDKYEELLIGFKPCVKLAEDSDEQH